MKSECNLKYSGVSEYRTLWDQYKFKWFVHCRDCPLLRDSNCIILIGGLKFGDLVLSIVERYLIVALIRSVH